MKNVITVVALASLLVGPVDMVHAATVVPSSVRTMTQAPSLPQVRPTEWTYRDQEEFIVDEIGRDIAEVLLFAAAKPDKPFKLDDLKLITKKVDPATESYTYHLESSALPAPIDRSFKLNKCIFGTDNYSPFAQQIIDSLHLKSTASPEPSIESELLAKLSDGSMESLYQENEHLSWAINKSPLDPALHEQAALLMSAFHMHDVAGNFHDRVHCLERMTAHVALAEALRAGQTPSVSGQLAPVALLAQSSRDTEGTERAIALEKLGWTDPIQQSWVRTLKIMASNDYRYLSEQSPTAIEALEAGRRLAYFVHGDSVVAYLEKHPQPESIRMEWQRIVQNGSTSVDTGHMFMRDAMSAEFDDFYSDYQRWNGHSFNDLNQMPIQLNKVPTRAIITNDGAPKLEVVSWDDVANFHAREILCGFVRSFIFNSEHWGVKEEADKNIAQAERSLSELTQYPFCFFRVRTDNDNDTVKAMMKRAQTVIVQHPDLVTDTNWLGCWEKHKDVITPPDLWFGQLPLYGTAMDFYVFTEMHSPKVDMKALDDLRNLALYNSLICKAWTKKKYGKHPTGAQYDEGYGKMMGFDVNAEIVAADADYRQPDQFVARYEKIAKVLPGNYEELAKYSWLHNKPAETAKYYELFMKTNGDAVYAANVCEWLVNYWYDHGRKAEAAKLAAFAGEVYSELGLQTAGRFAERTGDLSEAEQQFKNIKERYDDDQPLMAFYERHATNPQYSGLAKPYVDKVFPHGLRKVTLHSFQSAPTNGTRIARTWDAANQFGMKKGQIIVGVNGYGVENLKQYYFVRQLTAAPRASVIVWNGKTYQQIDRPSAGYTSFGDFTTGDYKPGEKSKAATEDEDSDD